MASRYDDESEEALRATEALHAMLERRVFFGSPTRADDSDEDRASSSEGGGAAPEPTVSTEDSLPGSGEGSVAEGHSREDVMRLEESLEEAMMATEDLHRNVASVVPSSFARPRSPPPEEATASAFSQRIVSFADIDLADYEIEDPGAAVPEQCAGGDGSQTGLHEEEEEHSAGIDTEVEESTGIREEEEQEEERAAPHGEHARSSSSSSDGGGRRRDAKRRIDWAVGGGEPAPSVESDGAVAAEASAGAVSTVSSEADVISSASGSAGRPAAAVTDEEAGSSVADDDAPYRGDGGGAPDGADDLLRAGAEMLNESVSTLVSDDDEGPSGPVAGAIGRAPAIDAFAGGAPTLPPRRTPRAARSSRGERPRSRGGGMTTMVDRGTQVGCYGIGTQVSYDEEGRFLYDADDIRTKLLRADFLQRFRGDAVRNVYARIPTAAGATTAGGDGAPGSSRGGPAAGDAGDTPGGPPGPDVGVEDGVVARASELRYRQRLECIRNRLAILSSG